MGAWRDMSLGFDEYLLHIDREAAAFDAAFAQCPADATVTGCPDWTPAQLRDHTAGVLAFWLMQLAEGDGDADGPTFPPTARARAAEVVVDLAAETLTVLRELGPDAPCWNWSGANPSAGWVARRMANEISIHRADAEATAGIGVGLPADLATDGIDELIEVFVNAPPDEDLSAAPVLGLTTPDRSWTLAVSPQGVQLVPAGRAMATVSGSPVEVVLRLWGRPSKARIDGDRAVLEAWDALATFQ